MMNISSTSSTLSTLFGAQTLDETKKSQEASQAAATKSGTSVLSSQDTDQAVVSQFGQLMSKLQQMASTDQDGFKAATQTISDNLAQSASETTDPTQKEAFAYISTKFAEAAKTGDMSSLKDVGQAMLGVSATASGGAAGGDTVTISSEGKDLASKDGSTGSDSSGSGSSEETSTDADAASTEAEDSTGASQSAGQAKAAGGGGGSSSSSSSDDTTVSDLEDEIDDMKVKIKAMQGKVDQAKQEARGDDSKADALKAQEAQLSSLNVQLSQLQLEKLQAESEASSSSSSSSSASGGASMTT